MRLFIGLLINLLASPIFGSTPIVYGKQATVLVFVASQCPCTDPHRKEIHSLTQQHTKPNIAFYAIFSNKKEARVSAERFMKQTEWSFPFVIDARGELVKKYGAKITPEVFLLNAKQEIVYRGAIDDSVPNLGQIKNPHLRTALTQLVNGKTIDPKSTSPYGCYIVR